MTQKLSYEFIYQEFINGGCKLLEEKYRDNRTPMKYICKCGNESKISYGNFKKGRRCQKCKAKINSEKQRLDISYVKSVFEKEGYKLLNGEYENNQSRLEIECPIGHVVRTQFGTFQMGYKCRICGIEKRSGHNHHKWNPDREQFEINKLFKRKCLSALRKILLSTGKKKNTKSSILNGYTWIDLREYLLSHPNWENVKNDDWELDHIFPIKAFIDYGLTELHHIKIINGLDNLQPLSKKDNGCKKDKYIKEDFENWLKHKGITCCESFVSFPQLYGQD